ncbi:hypothetical protein O3M35_000527 [Rhynocoris fuscipes]|uniref:Gustatory receptor n=1 Tax=Rhynocoris fuscipes TaxID=488301 RepID=A0AAW1DMV0_9HEMI
MWFTYSVLISIIQGTVTIFILTQNLILDSVNESRVPEKKIALYILQFLGIVLILENLLHLYSLCSNNKLWSKFLIYSKDCLNENQLKLYGPNLLLKISVLLSLIGIICRIYVKVTQECEQVIYAYSYLYYSEIFILYLFCIYLELLSNMFDRLNHEISSLNDIKLNKKCIKFMTDKHSDLIDLTDDVNALFSIQNLVICLTSLAAFTAGLYSLFYVIFVSKKFDYNFYFRVDDTVRSILKVSFLVYFCEKLVKYFNLKLFHLLKKTPNINEYQELMFYNLKERKASFTAGGIIQLGYPFIGSMLGTALTYVIIVIQFNQSSGEDVV